MDLRDEFAAAALIGSLAGRSGTAGNGALGQDTATRAYQAADAMLAERAKAQPQAPTDVVAEVALEERDRAIHLAEAMRKAALVFVGSRDVKSPSGLRRKRELMSAIAAFEVFKNSLA